MDGQAVIPDDLPTILTEPLRLSCQPGLTLQQIVDLADLPPEVTSRIILVLNGAPAKDWAHILTLDGDVLDMLIVPAGGGDSSSGKSIITSLAVIAISIYAPALASTILGAGYYAGGVAVAGAAISTAGYALTAGITLAGTMAVSALIKPDPIATGTRAYNTASENPAYQITGQSNDARPYGTVPRIYGTTRYYPLLMSTPYFSNVGKKSSMAALYDYGIGTVDVTNVRVGDQAITQMAPKAFLHQNSLGTALKLVAKVPDYAELTESLEQGVDFVMQTHSETINATLDLYFPQGLAAVDSNGNRQRHTASFKAAWRLSGDTAWTAVPATDYHGATHNAQDWVWQAEYNVTSGTPFYYWGVVSDALNGNSTSRMFLVADSLGVFDVMGTSGGSDANWSHANTTEQIVDGKPYRRGVLRQTLNNVSGGGPNRTVQYYEILMPHPRDASVNVVQITAATLVPFVVSIQMHFPASGTYDVKITRTSPVTEGDDATKTQVDIALAAMLTSFHGGKVINLKRRHTIQEMLFSATDTLNSSVDGVNGICSGWVRSVTATGWGSLTISSNPAHIALDIATGPACHKPLDDNQIDFPSWFALAQRCDEDVTTKLNGVTYVTKRHQWNGVIDTDITAQSAIDAVLAVARAARTTTANGKFGVLLDIPKSDYRQLITPANSWGFEATRTFAPIPDAFRVTFVDSNSDYMPREVLAYRDGKNWGNSDTIEDLATWGITNVAQAWRHGRYMLAQGLLRSETFNFYMDVENLAFGRGDLVLMQHDVPEFGGMAARVTSTDGGQIISVNRPLELGAGNYTLRTAAGPIIQGTILSQINPTTYRLDKVTGALPDDLIVLGDKTTNARPYIVMGIEAGEDLTARVTLVSYNNGVYTADEGDIPDWDAGFGDDVDQTTNVRVQITSLTYAWVFDDGIPYAEVTIKWRPTAAKYAYVGADVALITGPITAIIGQISKAGSARLSYRIPYNAADYFNVPLTFSVRPKSVSGLRGRSAEQDITLTIYDSTPEPPTSFASDVHGSALALSWHPSPSKDILVYIVRYTPDTVNPTWATSQFVARVEGKLTSVTAPVRAGTYMVRAMNVIGKQSTILTLKLPMESIPNMALFATLDDAPLWTGTKDGFQAGYAPPGGAGMQVLLLDKTTIVVAGMTGVTDYHVKLLNGTYVYVGIGDAISTNYLVSNVDWKSDLSVQAVYTSPTITDLGAIYETHIQVNMLVGVTGMTETRTLGPVQGYGITPFVAAPTPYADTDAYDSGWSVWLEYRTKGASGDPWGAWVRVAAGVATGRYFQFRIVGSASASGAMIIVYNGKITLSFANRNWLSGSVSVPIGGLTVDFVPPFFAPPTLAITPKTTGGLAASYSVENVTPAHATLKVLQLGTTTPIAGVASINAAGFGTERTVAI